MKKTCSGKESKVITTKDVDGAANENWKDESLTEEQVLINKKLSESGIKEEGLGWLEKKSILKTISASLGNSPSDKVQRSSPRLSKTPNPKSAKWVENSFDIPKKENSPKKRENENTPEARSSKSESENSTPNIKSKNIPPVVKVSPILYNSSQKSGKSKKDADINGEITKSVRKIHYVKVEVEGSEECSKSVEEESAGSSGGRKRASQTENETANGVKKFKMEETNDGVPLQEELPSLKLESEMEKRRQNVVFAMRDIQTIVHECEIRNQRWNETYSRYEFPARWGTATVKNSTEKWDGKRIPPKLLHRYQKFLSSNNMCHPVFLPTKLQGAELNILDGEIGSQSSTGTLCDIRDDLDNEIRDATQFSEDESKTSENNLNASGSEGGRMVLRNRNQQKPLVIDEDDGDSRDSEDWFSKQKPNKKQKTNSKNRKNGGSPNKQLVLKLERCNINKRSEAEEGRKGDEDYAGSSLMGNNGIIPMEGVPKSGPDPDTMVCPICSLRFKKQLIESHATECASKTYKD